MKPGTQGRVFVRTAIAAGLRNSLKGSGMAVVIGLSVFPWSSGAMAQTDSDSTPVNLAKADGIEEVIVTARRREESAQTVPISITALGADKLEDMQITSLESLEAVVPDLTVSQASGRPNAPVYSLRGIRPTEAVYGQEPTVAIYFSDVVLSPAQGSNMGMYDLASVQVLKGPQGTLFGRNTTGGAILLTPKKPGREFASDVMVGYGSFGKTETQVGIDMPLSDKFRLRAAGRTIDSDGYQTNVAPGPLYGSKLGGEQTRNARLTAVWEPGEALVNTTVFSYDNKETNGRGTTLQAANPNSFFLHCWDGPDNPLGACFEGDQLPSIYDLVDESLARPIDDVESDQRQFDNVKAYSVINTTEFEFSDQLMLKSIAGYRKFESELFFDLDASRIAGLLTSNQNAKLEHASYELQLLGNTADKRFDWVTGLYYYYENGFENSPGETYEGHPFFENPIYQRGDVLNNSYSVFAQGNLHLTDQLTATAGARMTWDQKEMRLSTHRPSSCSLNVDDGNGGQVRLPLDECFIDLDKNFSQPTGTVSLQYMPRDGAMVYAAANYGYRAGGFNIRADAPIEYEPFDPETVLDAELGAKVDWFAGDWRMRSNIVVYNQWYDDIQRTVAAANADGTPGSAVQNAAKATVFGIEFNQTFEPTRNVSLQLNYTYTDPEYDSWSEINSSGTEVDLTDTPFYFTPKHAGNATLSLNYPVANDNGLLTLTATAAYKGEMWINALHTITIINAHPEELRDELLKQESYWTLDMSMGWKNVMGSEFDILGYVDNATDERYAVGGVQLYATFGMTARAYSPPRTYGVQLRYRF